jgi:hypothetical protein
MDKEGLGPAVPLSEPQNMRIEIFAASVHHHIVVISVL